MAQTNTHSSNYSILVDAELDLKKIQQQLKSISGQKITLDSSSLKDVSSNADAAERAVSDLGLTFQQANMIMSQSVEIISSMVSQVYDLDSSITELRKVSDLQGKSLDKYVDKLADAGQIVARTG
jgi:hypothetical protein